LSAAHVPVRGFPHSFHSWKRLLLILFYRIITCKENLGMPHWMTDTFTLGAPLAEKVLRPIVVYFFLVAVLRVFGKRELAQLNPFDLVVLLSLSNTVQNAIIGNDNSLTGGLIGAFALLGINYCVVRFLFRHRRLDQLFEGKPTTLITDGKVCKQELAKELLTHSELMTVLHRQGFDTVTEIEKCVLEPGGTFYIQRKTPPTEVVQHQELLEAVRGVNAKLDRLIAARPSL
jgi:uncharacterized membrane protein YcaP (DUF421 family)